MGREAYRVRVLVDRAVPEVGSEPTKATGGSRSPMNNMILPARLVSGESERLGGDSTINLFLISSL